jgi:hypothetical protein
MIYTGRIQIGRQEAGANVIKSAEMTKNGKWMSERIRIREESEKEFHANECSAAGEKVQRAGCRPERSPH